jgi:hypothetical protein
MNQKMKMLKVGTIVRLKTPLMDNNAGTIGVCYEVYDHGWGRGVSVIFQNGNYDGFSTRDQDLFLEFVRETNFTYNFQSVIKLFQDFTNGMFNEVLEL